MDLNELRGALPEPICTRRLALRRPVFADVPALALLANNKNIANMLANLPHPYTSEDAISFIEHRARGDTEHAFAITLADGPLIGVCGITIKQARPPEIGYWLGETYWGAGYATEVAAALVDAVFTAGPFPEVTAWALAANPASCRVLEKTGFSLKDDKTDDSGRHSGARVKTYAIDAAARRAAH